MAAAKNLQKSYFDVLGLCCSSEVPLVENILSSLEGVKEFSVIVPTRTVVVVHDNLLISQLQIVKALNRAGLEANVRAYGKTNHKKKWPSPYAIGSGVLLALSFLKYVYHPSQWLALAAVAVGILPILLKSFASLRSLRLDINVLALIAVIGTIAMKDYVEAGTIVFLFTVAQWLESRASHKAAAVMESLMSLAPQKAIIAETGEEVDVGEVKLNTIVAVKAGEVIPIDGVVVDGTGEVDEKTLTGESFPVPKQKDSTVWAGTINLNGYITVKSTALAEDCVVAKMAKLVEEAQNSKTRTQRFIDRCAQYYTPVVIFVSGCVALIPFVLRLSNRSYWFHFALVVLVSACPCALILSTPVATFCALTKAATSGLLIKGGDYLETLAKIKVMAFDKTGTITRGEFVVTEFESLCEDVSLQPLLHWVSSIESKSSHPMAAALVDYGRSCSIEPRPEDVENFQNFPGEGICGKIDGKDVYIGNRKIALRAGCETEQTLDGDRKGGKTTGYVYVGATLAGIFYLSDACRTGAAEAIKELKSLGIRTAMLTGDNEAAALHAQEQLGKVLDIVHAELLPKDKARILTEFKKNGRVAMIGDGLNDAPALATADIGISMGISGSALATETGNVILMSNDLRKVPKVVQLARKAHRKVIENVLLSISTKGAILALAFAGHPLVWAAVVADVGTCLLVILNSMLLLRGTHKHGGNYSKSSASKHDHKHGCHTKSSNSSNTQGNGCSKKKVQTECRPQKCSSVACASRCETALLVPNSSLNNVCTKSADRKDCCADIRQAKHSGNGSCGAVNHESQSHDSRHGHCSNLMESESHCKEGDEIHEVDHCNHDVESQSACKTQTHSNMSDGHGRNGHCHSIDHGGSEHKADSSCNDEDHHHHQHHHHHHQHHRHQNSALHSHQQCRKDSNGPQHTTTAMPIGDHHLEDHWHSIDHRGSDYRADTSCNDEDHRDHHHHHHYHENSALHHHQECCTDSNEPQHTTIAIPMGDHHVESSATHACMSLEKRPLGGCCRSYVRDCCKREHFGAPLTEIITE